VKYEGDRIWTSVRQRYNINVSDFTDDTEFLVYVLGLMADRKTKLPNLGDDGKTVVLEAALDWYSSESGREIEVPAEEIVRGKIKPIEELGYKAKTTTGKTYVLTKEEMERIARENKSIGRFVAGKLVGLERRAMSGVRRLFG